MNSQQPKSACRVELAFDPILAVYVLMIMLMAMAVAYSISLYLSWWVAAPIGVSLTYCFSRLVKTVVAPRGMYTPLWRAGCAGAAIAVFGVTMGLSYATLYAKFLAQTSAINHFQAGRTPVQRQLETLAGNAKAASNAFAAWDAHSTAKADKESKEGGTCPAKAASASGRGPIAMFRTGEAGIAANLHAELKVSVDALAARLEGVAQRKPANFAETMQLTGELNAAIESGESLAHGALVRSARKTIQQRIETEIAWPNGEVFTCGDTVRDELLKRALEALPALSPLVPGIDLSNPQSVANRGLLRSFNALMRVTTLGFAGSFEDDPLMTEALKKGVVNQETLGMFTASLLELCVVLTAVMASRRGAAPFGFRPMEILAAWQDKARAEPRFAVKLAQMLAIMLVKGAVNMLWAYPSIDEVRPATASKTSRGGFAMGADPQFPARELAWATSLAPFLVPFHGDEYVCIPAGRSPKASMAARTLCYRGAAVLIHGQAVWEAIATNRVAAFQLQRLVPDAKALAWEVFKLEPSFAQALRLALLGGGRP